MKIIFLSFLIIQLIFVSTFAQSKCYLMGVWTGKKSYLIYESLELNDDKTFISTSLYDLQFNYCGIYEIEDDIIKLYHFKSDSIVFCEEPDVIKNILNSDYKTELFEKYKIKNNRIYLLNKKGNIKRRIKDNSFRTNLFADLFGKTYFYKEIDCAELQRIQQN